MKIILNCLFVLTVSVLQSQTDTLWHTKPALNITGFVDVFYAYDFNKPAQNKRQEFFYNHNRHNEFNINLGLLKLNLQHPKYRANIAFQTGTYSDDNYAAEPGLLKIIFEANTGLSLNRRNTLWLDAGVFPSHIGFESAISSDNFTLTRSILAENSPYYLSGIKMTYEPSQNWEFTALVCNGWQRIQRIEGSTFPAFGTRIKFKSDRKFTLNWSTFLGTDDPDTIRRMRYFNNFFAEFQLSEKIRLLSGFDLGFQQKLSYSKDFDIWFSPVLITQYSLSEKWRIALRAEYYQDKSGVIVAIPAQKAFKVQGFSFNLDYSPVQNAVWRIEARWLNSEEPIFENKNGFIKHNFFLTTSLAVKLNP